MPKEFPVWSLNWLRFVSAANDRKPIIVALKGHKIISLSSECGQPELAA